MAILGWGNLMAATGSAIDAYPSRWIHSPQFASVVILGCLSGALFWGAMLPWKHLKITVSALLSVGTPMLFWRTYYSWFEMYDWVERTLPESKLRDLLVSSDLPKVGRSGERVPAMTLLAIWAWIRPFCRQGVFCTCRDICI